MSVPPLHLSNNFDSYISGEVTIHPSAVLAPGVILQAAVNSKIIIGPGVCIGMGSIIQVSEGSIEVEAGANLGAGFLMLGKGKIGANACIGSATTVYNCSIGPGLVIAPGSILGDTSRRVEVTTPQESPAEHGVNASTEQQPEAKNSLEANEETVMSSTSVSKSSQSSPTSKNQPPPVEAKPEANNSIPQASESSQPPTRSPNHIGNQIYGQGSIKKLLVTLFPHRQNLNDPISDEKSE